MSNYPNQIDDDSVLPSVIDGSTETGAEAINAQKAAILAVERTVGADPQGSLQTVAERLDVSLNPDGTIKSAALTAAGLAALPLSNSDISPSAAIEESKLDLDVSTQSLQNQINSNDVDIYALQNSQTSLSGQLAQHIVGTAQKHDAEDVVVSPSILGGANVQTAIQAVADELADHQSTQDAHAAENISYTPPSGTDLTFTNVGEALDGLLDSSVSIVREHFRTAHLNGISVDGYLYSEQNTGAALATTIYTPLGGNRIIKIGTPNNPTIRSHGISPFALSASAANIDIEYWDGYTSNTVSITGLNSAAYPAGTENRLRGIVGLMNSQLATARAPVFAFEDRGELSIQHGLPDGYIKIIEPVSSAAVALGFADVVDVFSYLTETESVVTDGVVRTGYASYQNSTGVIASPTATIQVASGTAAGSLVYITEHPTSSGVYQILSISGTNALLNATLAVGSYRYRIFADSVGSGGASAGRTHDITIDSDLTPSISVRSSITTSQISNLVISFCDMVAGNYSLALTGSGSTRYLQISDGVNTGPVTQFSNGWLGSIKVLGPDLSGYIVVDTRATSLSFPATDQFTVHYSGITDSVQRIASFWSNGSTTEYAVDLRNFDLSTAPAVYPTSAISGFAVSYDATTVEITGGTASIRNEVKEVPGGTFDFSSLTGAYNIWLDDSSVIRVTTAAAPYTFASIVARGGVPLSYVVASAGVDAAYDCVLFSADLSNFTISSTLPASCRTLDGGLTLADNLNVVTATILTTEIAALDVSTSQINISAEERSLLFSGAAAFTDCTFTVGEIVTSALTLSGESRLFCEQLIVEDLILDGSQLISDSVSVSSSISISGTASRLSGWKKRCAFDSSVALSIDISSVTDCSFVDVDMIFAASSLPFFAPSGTNDGLVFKNITATTNTAISASDAGSTTLYAAISNTGTTSGVLIEGCSFSNRASLVLNSVTLSDFLCRDTDCTSSGGVFRNTGAASNILFKNIGLSQQTGTCVASSLILSGLVVDGLRVIEEFPTSTTFKLIDISSTVEDISFSGIRIRDLDTASNLITSSVNMSIDDIELDTVSAGYIFAPSAAYIKVSRMRGIALTSKLLSGEALLLSDSQLAFSSITGSPVAAGGAWTDYRSVFERCDITMPTGTALTLRDFWINDSQFQAGSFVFSASTTDNGYRLAGSDFVSTNTAATTAFNFTGLSNGAGGTPYAAHVSGCTFTGSPTTYLVAVSAGLGTTGATWLFESNELNLQSPASGQAILKIGDAETTNAYFVKNNTLSVGGGTVAQSIYIVDKNVFAQANNIRATGVSSYLFGTNASVTQSGVRILDNHIYGTNVAATTNLALVAGRLSGNTGIETVFSHTAFGSEKVSGTWSITGDQVTNTAAISQLSMPLVVPAGLLTEIEIDVYAAGAIGTITCSLYSQPASVASPAFKTSGSNAIGASLQTITLSPSSLYVNTEEPLFLNINTTAANNLIGSIRVKVKL